MRTRVGPSSNMTGVLGRREIGHRDPQGGCHVTMGATAADQGQWTSTEGEGGEKGSFPESQGSMAMLTS